MIHEVTDDQAWRRLSSGLRSPKVRATGRNLWGLFSAWYSTMFWSLKANFKMHLLSVCTCSKFCPRLYLIGYMSHLIACKLWIIWICKINVKNSEKQNRTHWLANIRPVPFRRESTKLSWETWSEKSVLRLISSLVVWNFDTSTLIF